jgi:Glycosyl transferase family 11
MIGITLSGGLGNQMFQYAAAYSLARRCGTDVAVNTSDYWHAKKYQKFELWRFPSINLKPISRAKAVTLQILLRGRLISAPTPTYVRESLGFDRAFFECGNGSQLCGYFQSIKYFGKHLSDLRSALSLKQFLLPSAARALDQFTCGREVVSVHVRRGDYLQLPIFQLNSDQYYKDAIGFFDKNALFIVISDDLTWCRSHPAFRKKNVYFLSDLGIECTAAIQEMALMSCCNHNIIANSTFSWWAGLLNTSENKKVVMPRQWLAQYTADQCGLSVPGWTQV